SRALRARADEVPERVAALQDQVKKLHRELEQTRRTGATRNAALDAATVEEVSGVRVAHLILDGVDGVADAADSLYAERLQGDGVAVVMGTKAMAVKVGGRALQAGLHAGELVRAGAEATGAKGYGR